MPNSPSRSILRYDHGVVTRAADELAVEEPLEIRVRGRAISITMRTPGHDDELTAGFLVSEGLIGRAADVVAIEPCAHPNAGNIVNVFLAAGVEIDFEKLTRHVFASSSCGLCGKASIDAICEQFPPIESDVRVAAPMLLSLPGRLREAQSTFDRTGGLHGVALFDAAGNLIVAREDVGRHNAVDKVIGYGLLNDLLPFDRHVLMVSGRASFEIMQKALAARIPVVAAVSAPSTLAADFAQESGMTLVGFLRDQRMNVYAGLERVAFND
jgi:FdhD protein